MTNQYTLSLKQYFYLLAYQNYFELHLNNVKFQLGTK